MKKEILYDGKKITYHVYGSGKPVLLIHGFGELAAVWDNQVEFLKDKFKLIVPDLPGSCNSEMIDNMSIDSMAEVIHSIIQEEHIEKATIIGHSMGGYITLALAEKYRSHVNAFGMLNSTAFADSEEKKAVRRKGIEFINTHGAVEFIKTTTPNLFAQEFKDKQPGFTDEYISTLNNFSSAALVRYYEAMIERPDRISVLRNTDVPVLFIMGKYDNTIPVNDSMKQCHLPGIVYFHCLKQSGHMGMLEEAAATNCILEKYLSEN